MRELFEIDDEIVEIEYLGEEETVDINCSGNRLFYANDILTHNSAVDATEFDHSHIAGGKSKIDTADNVIGIHNTQSLRDRGEIRFQYLKTRNSSGVGKHTVLKFDVDTLRISDLDESDQQRHSNSSASIMNSIHNRNKTSNKNINNDANVPQKGDETSSVVKNQQDLRALINRTRNK